jgi:hypothetical protein
MAEQQTDSAPVETPDESTAAVGAGETDAESTGQEKEETPASTDESASDKEGTDPASDAGKRSDSEQRATETAKKQAIEIRNLKRQMRELQAQRPAMKPDELAQPVEPKIEDYYAADDPTKAHQDAMKKFRAETEKYAVEKYRREQESQSLTEQQKKQQLEDSKAWVKKEADTVKRHPDYPGLENIVNDISPNGTMAGFFLDSDIGPEVAYHLQQNPEIADNIRELGPFRAMRELIEIEGKLLNAIKGIKPKPSTAGTVSQIKGGNAGPAKPKSVADLLYGNG